MMDHLTVLQQATRGWDSDFLRFESTKKSAILASLSRTYPDSSVQEQRSWRDSVPRLQREIREVVEVDVSAGKFTAILEYQLEMESRRADVLLLLGDSVVVIELKGKRTPSDSDIDQAHAYSRDLRCYHRDCHNRSVHAVLIPTGFHGARYRDRNVEICSPEELDNLVTALESKRDRPPLEAERFLSSDAYLPLPSLVRAARDLFLQRRPPQLWRSAANTDRAVDYICRVSREARVTGTRHLVILPGVPGSGKTLVGLRVAHSPEVEELKAGDRGVPAVFLSGNRPLVEVLQYVLRNAGGGGKTFVRQIRDYVRRYGKHQASAPPEHIMVFDEAQRAFDRYKMADTHNTPPTRARSEPEYFIDFAERVPEWSVVVGLVGGGQEIHIGEEGGLALWSDAIRESKNRTQWVVHCPPEVRDGFVDSGVRIDVSRDLSLDSTLRSHLASRLHEFVALLLQRTPAPSKRLQEIAIELMHQGHDLRITRDRTLAEAYLRDRYRDYSEARFGLVASSRDRDLKKVGVPNDYISRQRIKCGPWYNDDETADGQRSCRHLTGCITEFEAQGLELDAVLLAWGTDFALRDQSWSIEKSMVYRGGHSRVRDAWQLRANAYRVLLTRGRDAHVVYVPEFSYLDETWEFLCASGFRALNRQ